MSKIVFAIAAHPDDIEFMMGGTLLLLKEKGCALHYLNVANGSCGTNQHDAATIIGIRREEARHAAEKFGATYHESLANDVEVFYNKELLAKLASIVRAVKPDLILTHWPNEYMEDHVNTCRLAVSAAFTRSMINFPVAPPRPAIPGNVTVYHGLPYGLFEPLKKIVNPEIFVDVSRVQARKKEILACHASQKNWLDVSQGLDSYLHTMSVTDGKVGTMSGKFTFAEGWTRRLHLGLGESAADPLTELLPESVYAPGPG